MLPIQSPVLPHVYKTVTLRNLQCCPGKTRVQYLSKKCLQIKLDDLYGKHLALNTQNTQETLTIIIIYASKTEVILFCEG